MYSVKQNVVKELSKLFGNQYNNDNVNINGQHTHSGAGGYSHHVLYNVIKKILKFKNFCRSCL